MSSNLLIHEGDLKKHASKVGVSPMGTQDEILAEYVNYLNILSFEYPYKLVNFEGM